jgi:hypothetical protein
MIVPRPRSEALAWRKRPAGAPDALNEQLLRLGSDATRYSCLDDPPLSQSARDPGGRAAGCRRLQ